MLYHLWMLKWITTIPSGHKYKSVEFDRLRINIGRIWEFFIGRSNELRNDDNSDCDTDRLSELLSIVTIVIEGLNLDIKCEVGIYI
jgi:hypothetical protein